MSFSPVSCIIQYDEDTEFWKKNARNFCEEFSFLMARICIGENRCVEWILTRICTRRTVPHAPSNFADRRPTTSACGKWRTPFEMVSTGSILSNTFLSQTPSFLHWLISQLRRICKKNWNLRIFGGLHKEPFCVSAKCFFLTTPTSMKAAEVGPKLPYVPYFRLGLG